MAQIEARDALQDERSLAESYELYEEAFPKDEKLPWESMVEASRSDIMKTRAFYDDGKFVGFTNYFILPDVIFVMYLAVSNKVRSHGYGSAILEWLASEYPESSLALDIEPMDPQADNWNQRQRRLRFYERNGFHMTPYDVFEYGIPYTVLSTDDNFQPLDFTDAWNALGLEGETPYLKKVR
ncbi:MAG: GNAT family N-acetyltransferase [Eggerthellaceae bacterium]|jgi:GNAT superfamily N-acetyltransferase